MVFVARHRSLCNLLPLTQTPKTPPLHGGDMNEGIVGVIIELYEPVTFGGNEQFDSNGRHFSSETLEGSNHGEITGPTMACAGTPNVKRGAGTLGRVRKSNVAER